MGSRGFPSDTRHQRILTEHFNKERDSQLAWFMKMKENECVPGASDLIMCDLGNTANRTKLPRVDAAEECGMARTAPVTTRDFRKKKMQNSFDYELYRKMKADMAQGGMDHLLMMKQPNERTKTLLYDGFSHHGKGRYQYLKKRKEINPEEKFPIGPLSSMVYGWRLYDVIDKNAPLKSVFGRTKIIADTFYTRTGIPIVHCGGILERSKTLF